MAAIDADEPAHAWAALTMRSIAGRFLTCEACVTEAVHIMGNSAPAVRRLKALLARMDVVSFADGAWKQALDSVIRRAPVMDYADACVVHMVQTRRDSFALTLDTRDFSSYRIPFASPEGDFHI